MKSTSSNHAVSARYSGRTVAALAVCVVAIAGIGTTVLMVLASHEAGARPATSQTPVHHASGVAIHTVPKPPVIPSSGSSSHTVPQPPPVVPVSPTVELLQQQLAQLDYYDGPINGYFTGSTVQAVEYLQRDAHLPQTGQLDRATQVALDHFVATGNNQMAS